MNIIYRPVPGYDDLYAGIDGSIVHGGKGRVLKQSCHPSGYLTVWIPKSKKAGTVSVHRLVAAAFLGPCLPGMEVRHSDGIKNNNQPANLCYGTRSDNMQDAVRHGIHPSTAKTECPQGHPYTPENTYIQPSGGRKCRICGRVRTAEYMRTVRMERRSS